MDSRNHPMTLQDEKNEREKMKKLEDESKPNCDVMLNVDLIDQEERNRQCIDQRQEKEHIMMKHLEDKMRPIEAFRTDPVDDSQRASALFLLAQQSMPRELRLPADLYEAIHQYSDYNEIRTLFRLLTFHDVRKQVFGFENYAELHREYRSKMAKMMYLKAFKSRSVPVTFVNLEIKITFDEDNVIIKRLDIKIILGENNDVSMDDVLRFVEEDRCVFNWDEMKNFKHLEKLTLSGMGIQISMDAIYNLPDSIKSLMIVDSLSFVGDVDLSLLPRGLVQFAAMSCPGFTGSLKLHAPDSKLIYLGLGGADLNVQFDSETKLPPSLRAFETTRNIDPLAIAFLVERGVEIDPLSSAFLVARDTLQQLLFATMTLMN